MRREEAIELIAQRMEGAETPSEANRSARSHGGSRLLRGQFDATLWRRFGTSRLPHAARRTGAANMALYGKMPSVVYADYPHARLIILWGVNPSASGIHLIPYVREAQKNGATLIVIDPRSTALARSADLHLAVKPGTDVAVALAFHGYLFANGHANAEFLAQHTKNADSSGRAPRWTIDKAAELAQSTRSSNARSNYHRASPALIRCGSARRSGSRDGDPVAAGGRRKIRRARRRYRFASGGRTSRNRIGARPEAATRIVNMNHLGRTPRPAPVLLFVTTAIQRMSTGSKHRARPRRGSSRSCRPVMIHSVTRT